VQVTLFQVEKFVSDDGELSLVVEGRRVKVRTYGCTGALGTLMAKQALHKRCKKLSDREGLLKVRRISRRRLYLVQPDAIRAPKSKGSLGANAAEKGGQKPPKTAKVPGRRVTAVNYRDKDGTDVPVLVLGSLGGYRLDRYKVCTGP